MSQAAHEPVLAPSAAWTPICRYLDLLPERGVAALVEGTQVAIFRTWQGSVHAIDNQDPSTGAFVLSRGIVGTRADVATVASPLHKQVFDLRTGCCLDDPSLAVEVHSVRTRAGVVEVRVARAPGSGARS